LHGHGHCPFRRPRARPLAGLHPTAQAARHVAGGVHRPDRPGLRRPAGASGALNMLYDADTDAQMRHTRARPVPAGRVQGADAAGLGVVLSLFSVMLMGMALNWLAAGLLAFTILFYAVVYTMWLKRSTAQNIVIGGLSGALPPAVGGAAASGAAPLNAWLLVAIIFMWTPPHFWALSLYTSEDYAKAGVPMMPVSAGAASTRRQILVYAALLVPLAV